MIEKSLSEKLISEPTIMDEMDSKCAFDATCNKFQKNTMCNRSVNESICDETIFYGIHIPADDNASCTIPNTTEPLVFTDKVQAMRVLKENKKARFKTFKTQVEACHFSQNGPSYNAVSSSPTTLSSKAALSSPYKTPKSQELVKFRKIVEKGDVKLVRNMIWENPHYLISPCDTPTILQEGSRYNILHVAAKACNATMCELVINTILDHQFIKKLYDEKNISSHAEHSQFLLDLFLNTPDKGLNETALHFAAKYGAVDVVEVFVSQPVCKKLAKNKYGQTPKDIICSRVGSSNLSVMKEIADLLEDRFYVPVLRTEDNSLQPAIGTPFCPSQPPVFDIDFINPKVEIHAYAGPMSHQEAVMFRKKWKTPPRISKQNINNNVTSSPFLRFQDAEKGLEFVGRKLAHELNVGWKEYWPFLGMFADFSTPHGLMKLEEFLKCKFLGQNFSSVVDSSSRDFLYHDDEESKIEMGNINVQNSGSDPAVSPITSLCIALESCSLSEKSTSKSNINFCMKSERDLDGFSKHKGWNSDDEKIMTIFSNPGISPFLYVEKSCQVISKRIADGFIQIVMMSVTDERNTTCSGLLDSLTLETKHLQGLITSYMDDLRFVSVDFHLIHSRIATMVVSKLNNLPSEDLEFLILGLSFSRDSQKMEYVSSDEEEKSVGHDQNISYRTQRKKDSKKDVSHYQQVKCIGHFILEKLEKIQAHNCEISKEPRVNCEADCMKVWADAVQCTCPMQSQNFSRILRRGASFKRSSCAFTSEKLAHTSHEGTSLPRKLNFGWDCDSPERRTYLGTGDSMPLENGPKVSSNSSSDDCNENFVTPPSSPNSSSDDEDEMGDPDEGEEVFIEGNEPCRTDIAVFNAISDSSITREQYPFIYRWRHQILLHSEKERERWNTPRSSRLIRSSQSTPERLSPVAAFSPPVLDRIAGQYAPSSPRLYK